jgi:hypothetical protein
MRREGTVCTCAGSVSGSSHTHNSDADPDPNIDLPDPDPHLEPADPPDLPVFIRHVIFFFKFML